MIGTLDDWKAAIDSLPESDRDELLTHLKRDAAIPSDHELPVQGLAGEAWLAELRGRSAEIDAGTAVLTPWETVRERVASRVFDSSDDSSHE